MRNSVKWLLAAVSFAPIQVQGAPLLIEGEFVVIDGAVEFDPIIVSGRGGVTLRGNPSFATMEVATGGYLAYELEGGNGAGIGEVSLTGNGFVDVKSGFAPGIRMKSENAYTLISGGALASVSGRGVLGIAHGGVASIGPQTTVFIISMDFPPGHELTGPVEIRDPRELHISGEGFEFEVEAYDGITMSGFLTGTLEFGDPLNAHLTIPASGLGNTVFISGAPFYVPEPSALLLAAGALPLFATAFRRNRRQRIQKDAP